MSTSKYPWVQFTLWFNHSCSSYKKKMETITTMGKEVWQEGKIMHTSYLDSFGGGTWMLLPNMVHKHKYLKFLFIFTVDTARKLVLSSKVIRQISKLSYAKDNTSLVHTMKDSISLMDEREFISWTISFDSSTKEAMQKRPPKKGFHWKKKKLLISTENQNHIQNKFDVFDVDQ